jgi:hypothetical protein
MLERKACMNFRISGLPVAPFTPLFGLSDHMLSARGVIRRIADRKPGYPCRVSLRDADVGESVLLLNYEHLPVDGPYRSSHAIYVREYALEAKLTVNEIPTLLQTRMLSVRAFDAQGMMVDADVVEGIGLAALIGRYLANSQIHFMHVHNAKPGCFAARIDRA